jgi:hypothetical protein
MDIQIEDIQIEDIQIGFISRVCKGVVRFVLCVEHPIHYGVLNPQP